MPATQFKLQPGMSWVCSTCDARGLVTDPDGIVSHTCEHPSVFMVSPKRPSKTNSAQRELTRPRYDLIPKEWLDCLAAIFEEGAKKYGERNWQDGGPDFAKDCLNHAMDHLLRFNSGDNSEEQLGKVAWNALAARTLWKEDR